MQMLTAAQEFDVMAFIWCAYENRTNVINQKKKKYAQCFEFFLGEHSFNIFYGFWSNPRVLNAYSFRLLICISQFLLKIVITLTSIVIVVTIIEMMMVTGYCDYNNNTNAELKLFTLQSPIQLVNYVIEKCDLNELLQNPNFKFQMAIELDFFPFELNSIDQTVRNVNLISNGGKLTSELFILFEAEPLNVYWLNVFCVFLFALCIRIRFMVKFNNRSYPLPIYRLQIQ